MNRASLLELLRGRCNSGVAAVEFALSLPLLVTLGMGGIELANFALVNLRINQVAIEVADNASRAKQSVWSGPPQFREYDVGETFLAADLAYPDLGLFENGRVILSSLETNAEGGQWIHWQRCRGAKDQGSSYGSEGMGSSGSDFAGMGPAGNVITAEPNAAIMFVEVHYEYRALLLPSATIPIHRSAAMYVRDDRDLSKIYNPSPQATVYEC